MVRQLACQTYTADYIMSICYIVYIAETVTVEAAIMTVTVAANVATVVAAAMVMAAEALGL